LVTAGREIPIRVVDDLRELNFGVCEGKNGEECPEVHKIFEGYVPEGGESYQEVYDRAERLLREVFLPLEGQADHVLVSSHGAFLNGVLRVIEKKPVETFWEGPPMHNCCAHVLELQNGVFTVREVSKRFF
jgi:probable phosphoglycerate mutase